MNEENFTIKEVMLLLQETRERLIKIEGMISEMNSILHGDGSNGLCKTVNELKRAYEQLKGGLEFLRWIVFLLSFLFGSGIFWIFSRK